MLLLLTGWLMLTGEVPTLLWIPCMVIAILIMLLFLWLIMDITWKMVAYCCMKAFLAAEFMASLEWQLEYFVHGGREERGIFNVLALIFVYGAVALVLFIIESRMKRDEVELEISVRELSSTLLIVLSAFMLSNLSFVYRNTPFSGTIASDIFTIRTLVDFGGLAILYAYQSLRYEVSAEKELSKIQSMLTAQYDSYRNYQEVTDLINMKYHDLKHQIAVLRSESGEERNAVLDRMEQEIKAYEAQNDTGNKVLDTVLTGKSLTCRAQNIQLTVVADGAALDFMDVMDISNLFGNALDNAIEGTAKVADPERRLIHLSVARQKGFAAIRIENCYDGELQFENGLPVTTKADGRYHGFGVKSIQNTAAKYGGTATITTHDGWFELRVLIPMRQKKEPSA